MKKADCCYRIGETLWLDKEKFTALLDLLSGQEHKVQDIALFVSPTHSIRKLECTEKVIPRLKCALQEVREHGFGSGINVLPTLGHHFENAAAIPEEISPLIDSAGNICHGTLCPSVPANREFMRKTFLLLTRAEPDFIWLDDDIRFAFHGSDRLVCFCDQCISDFNSKHGTSLSRENIVALFDSGTEEAKFQWRQKWLTFSGERLCEVFRFAEHVIHEAAPSVALGAMDAGMRVGDNATMTDLALALAGDSKRPLRWRPGGGAYNENMPDGFLYKAHMLGCESACLPDIVDNIQAEIENFNYQRLNKSVTATACESTLYTAAGLTGAAWNCIDGGDEKLSTYASLIKGLSDIKPFLDKQASWSRIRPVGVWHGWTSGLSAACGLDTQKPWESSISFWQNPHFSQLFTGALSAAYRLQDAKATILTAEAARTLSEEELIEVFSRGVYCPAAVLPVLEARGMADLTGFRVIGKTQFDAVEELLPHPLNEGAAGFLRDCRQSFPWGHEYGMHLESIDGKGIPLARLVNYQNRELASCSLGIYENALGGRVAVAGYYPLRDLHFEHKITTMKKLFRWLTKDTLPAELLSYHRIPMWCRECGDKTIVQMCNAYLDPAENVTIRVRSAGNTAVVTDWSMDSQIIHGQPDGTGKTIFTLPEIAPWHSVIIEIN